SVTDAREQRRDDDIALAVLQPRGNGVARPRAFHFVEPVERYVDAVVATLDISHDVPGLFGNAQAHLDAIGKLPASNARVILDLKDGKRCWDEDIARRVLHVIGKHVVLRDRVDHAGSHERARRQLDQGKVGTTPRAIIEYA